MNGAVIDFLFKCKHLSKDQQISELSKYETKYGNIMSAYKKFERVIEHERASEDDVQKIIAAKYDILKVLNMIPGGSIHFFKYEHAKIFLEDILNSTDEKAIELVLELLVTLQDDHFSIEVCTMIINSVLKLMKHENTSIIEINTKLLGKLCVVHASFCLPVIMKAINALGEMDVNSSSGMDSTTVTLRYIHMFHHMFMTTSDTSVCEELFSICLEHKCIDFIVGLIRSNDILIQMVALEYASIFSTSVPALEYFMGKGHFQWLIDCAMACASPSSCMETARDVDPMISTSCFNEASDILFTVRKDSLLADYFIQMFTNDMFTDMKKCVRGFMESNEEGERAAGLAGLAALCGLGTDYLHSMIASPVVEDWYALLNSGPEAQSAMLSSISTILLSYINVPDIDYQLAKRDLYRLVVLIGRYRRNTPDTMTYLLSLGNSPVDNTHMAALDLMNAIALQGKKNPSAATIDTDTTAVLGLSYLFSHLEFYLFIINRSTEYNKAGKDAKFTLIVNITQQPQFHLLNTDIVSVINHIVDGGPYVSTHGNGETADVQTMEL